jgi:hypothetical protein
MLRLFISHTWSADRHYQSFVERLNVVLGDTSWQNLSIPQSAAVDLIEARTARHKDALAKLFDELWEAQARLQDPKLRDAVSVTVIRDGKLVELPTIGSVRREIAKIESSIGEIEGPSREMRHSLSSNKEDPELAIARSQRLSPAKLEKFTSRAIEVHPDLSNALRDRIQESDMVFVLLTQMVRLNTWVDHE